MQWQWRRQWQNATIQREEAETLRCMGIAQNIAITREDEELEAIVQDVRSNGHTSVYRTNTKIGRPETSVTNYQ